MVFHSRVLLCQHSTDFVCACVYVCACIRVHVCVCVCVCACTLVVFHEGSSRGPQREESAKEFCVCVCMRVCVLAFTIILGTKVLILLAEWVHFAGPKVEITVGG